MPYRLTDDAEPVEWTIEYVRSMRNVRDVWGEYEYNRIYSAQKEKEPDLDRFSFLNKYFLARYELDERVPILEKLTTMVASNPPPPAPNPVELSDAEIELGQEMFVEHGLEMLIILALYSLPFSYASARGVKVLAGTQYLSKDPNRRLMETTQLVINVLTPGGLDRVDDEPIDDSHPVPALANPPIGRGSGLKMATMIRYLHSGIRPFIEERMPDYDRFVDGEPINQEDMAATLMTFAWIVPRGLERLHIDVPRETLDAYVRIWSHIGYEMGILPELLPANIDEAGRLANLIIEDQIDAEAARQSEYSSMMLTALLDYLRAEAPRGMKWVPAALMRHLFGPEHQWIADALGVPGNRWQVRLVDAGIWFEAKVLGHRLFKLGTRFIPELIIGYERAGRPAFRVPPELARKWGVNDGGRPGRADHAASG